MPGRSVGRPSSGSWSSLMSPVCRTVPAPERTAMASASGMEWLTAKYSHSNTPWVVRMPSATSNEHRLDPVLAAFRGDQGQGELRTDDRNVGTQLEQERDRPDVVFVRMGEHQRLDVVEPVFDVTKVGQDQVDAGLVVGGKHHPAVDDQQPAQVLENGHVAADFADAAERGHPQTTHGQRTRRLKVWFHLRATLCSPEHRSCAHVGSQCIDLLGRRRRPAAAAGRRPRCPAGAVPPWRT